MKHNKKQRITQEDFLLANRRASRAEEILAHGKQIQFRSVLQKSKKVYDRNSFKRAGIKSDDGSFCICMPQSFCNFATKYVRTRRNICRLESLAWLHED